MNSLISIDQAAGVLGVSKLTLYKYVSARKMPFIKIGARVLFREDELSEWIDSKSVQAIGRIA
jgi:excisionase family DNA binding protein